MSAGCQVCVGVSVLLIIIILFSASFARLDPLNAGLVKNNFQGTVNLDEIYTSGRYFLGIGKGFVRYPAHLQKLEFSDAGGDAPSLRVASQSASGDVQGTTTLELSFQYRLMLDKLGNIYDQFQTRYASKYLSVAESTLKNIASQRFSVTDYFENRVAVGEVFHAALNLAYNEQFAYVELFQLKNIQPPDATEQRVVDTLVTQEQQNLAEQQKLADLVRNSTNNLLIRTESVIENTIKAQADSTAEIIKSQGRADYIRDVIAAYGDAYVIMKEELNFTNSDILTHMYYENIRAMKDPSSIMIGSVDSALVQN
jgi:hypothetical protein